MTIKISELKGAALDWAVAKCEGRKVVLNHQYTEETKFDGWWQLGPNHWQPLNKYSADWAQGGPIIEREGISVYFENGDWYAKLQSKPVITYYDYSPLVAAMLCYVASKLGEEVEVPDELLQGESKYV